MRRPTSIRLPIALLALLLASGSAVAYQGRDADSPSHAQMPDNPQFRDALQACAAEQGLPPPPEPGQAHEPSGPPKGKRPDRNKLDACLRGKGFQPPGHGRGAPPPEDDEEW